MQKYLFNEFNSTRCSFSTFYVICSFLTFVIIYRLLLLNCRLNNNPSDTRRLALNLALRCIIAMHRAATSLELPRCICES